MKKLNLLAMSVAFAALAAGAGAQSFTLRVDPRIFDNVSYIASNPQSVTFNSGANGIGAYTSAPIGAAFLADHANVTAFMTDANNGGINFNDGWNSVNLNSPNIGGFDIGFLFPAATSEYSFTSATSIVVTVNWVSSVTGILNGAPYPTAFGIQDVYVGLDGNVQSAPGLPAPSSGTFTFAAGPGAHVLGFDDASNVGGSLGNYTASLNEQLTYNITAVPEPASLSILALGIGGLIARRRKRKA